jgi:AcrR family transcriptional regulator
MGLVGDEHSLTELRDFPERWREAQGFDASREVLRDAAYHIIHSRSLEELNMRGLAAQVGASAMAAYRYYPCKEALIDEIRLHIIRRFATTLAEAGARATDPLGRFRTTCMAYLDFAVRNEQDYRLMFGNAGDTTPIVPGTDGRAPAWEGLLRVLEGLYHPSRPSDLDDKAHLVWGSLHGIAMLHLSRRLNFGRSIQDLAEPILDFLANALGTDIRAAPTPAAVASGASKPFS